MDIRSFFGGGGGSGSGTAAKRGAAKGDSAKRQPKRKVLDDESEEEFEPEETKAPGAKKQAEEDAPESEEEGEAKEEPKEEPKEVSVKSSDAASKKKRVQVAEKTPARKKARKDVEAGKPVPYRWLAEAFDEVEATTKRLEIQKILCELFLRVLEQNEADLLATVYLCSNQVAPAHHGVEVGVGDSVLTKTITNVTGRTKKAISDKYEEEGDLGSVAMTFKAQQKTLFNQKPKALSLQEVFTRVKTVASTSKQDLKQSLIERMLVACTGPEVKYVVRLLQGKLRIGLAEQTVLIALAHALCEYHYEKQKEQVEAAAEDGADEEAEEGGGSCIGKPAKPTPELREKAVFTLKQVMSELPVYEEILTASLKPTKPGERWFDNLRAECHIHAGVPLKPMLAKPTNGVSEVLNRFQDIEFTCEYKYDGERAQIHMTSAKDADGVLQRTFKIYSRNSEDNTSKYPDIIEDIQAAFKAGDGAEEVTSFIMDTEAVAYDVEKATLLPFQVLSTRARKDVEVGNVKVKVIVCAFDLLLLNGRSLLEDTLEERRELLRTHFQAVEHKFCFAVSHDGKELEEIEAFLNTAVEEKCEGLMVKVLKGPDSHYMPARRSLNWLKLKKDYMNGLADSLDLVPIGAYHGKGKRTGTYGAYILAAYDADSEEFQSVTKIGTGFSDKVLEEFSTFFRQHVVEDRPSNFDCDMEPDVWLNPVQVWEVRAADLSISPVHRAAAGRVDEAKGIALRFPRFLRIRDDKSCEDATSAAQVAEMYLNQASVGGSGSKPDNGDDFF